MSQVTSVLSRVSTISLDAMFTLFLPHINGRPVSRAAIMGRIYRDTAGIRPEKISNAQIAQVIEEERLRLPVDRDDDRYWRLLNTEAFRRILTIAEAPIQRFHHAALYAETTREKFLRSKEYWAITPAMHNFLRQIKSRGWRIIVASNHREDALINLMRQDGKILDIVDRVYVSESIGVSKAFPEFWKNLVEEETLSSTNFDANNLVHIGNSPRSDIGACDAGIPLIIYDREHSLDKVVSRYQTNAEKETPLMAEDRIYADEELSNDDQRTIISLSDVQHEHLIAHLESGLVHICHSIRGMKNTVLQLTA